MTFCKTLAVVCFVPTLLAQVTSTSGTISGAVKDASGGVIPGGTVIVRNVETGSTRTLTTDSQGRFGAPSLNSGEYELEVNMSGFQSEVKRRIRLTVGQEVVVEFVLKVGEVTEKVEVMAEVPLVETKDSGLSGLVDNQQIQELPLNGRSFDTLIGLEAGAHLHNATQRSTIRTNEYTINGNRTMANRFLVDGTESGHANIFNNPGSVVGTNLGVDALQEFRILKSGYDASYGKHPGGQIVMITRSGTNQVHGSVFHFLRNSVLDARNFFDLKTVPPFKRNNFGGSFGGKLIRDKTFFFSSYEGLRHRLGLSNVGIVLNQNARKGLLPDPADPTRLIDVGLNPAVVPYLNLPLLPNGRDFGNGTAELLTSPTEKLRDDLFVGRMDHLFSDKDSIFGSIFMDTSDLEQPSENAHFAQFRDVRSYLTTVQHQRIFSQHWINTLHLGFNRGWNEVNNLPTLSIDPSLSFVPGQIIGGISVGGTSVFEGLSLTPIGNAGVTYTLYVLNNYQLSDQTTIVRGRHNFKAGFEFNRTQQNIWRGNTRGNYTFADVRALLQGRPQTFTGIAPSAVNLHYWRQNYFAFYAHDTLQLKPTVTLNLGLRHEFTMLPTEKFGQISNYPKVLKNGFYVPTTEPRIGEPFYENHSLLNFAPRVGLAWDVNGNGKTSVRGSFGLFYDQFTNLYTRFADQNRPFTLSVSLDNPPFPHPDFSQPSNLRPGADTIDPDLKIPTTVQYTASVQRQLWKGTALTAAYVGSHGYHLLVAAPNNTALPVILPDGRYFIPAGTPRGNPELGRGIFIFSGADSQYHSLQLTLAQSLQGGFRYTANYTLSKNIDNSSQVNAVQSTNTPSAPQNPWNLSADKGLSALHVGHLFVLNWVWKVPFGTGGSSFAHRIAAGLVGDWELSGITSVSSGIPFTARTAVDRSRLLEGGTADRPDLKPGCSNNPVRGGPDLYFDYTCFELPAAGFFGNAGRNTILGPRSFNQDFSLLKNVGLGERLRLQFRAEVFNLFNHANFSVPTGIVTSASGARIRSTVTTSRQIQFGLKITF